MSASRFLGSLAVRRSKTVAFFWSVASEFPRSLESAINAATALSTVTLFESSGATCAGGVAGAYSVGRAATPVRSHSSAKVRAASKSRALSGGKNFAVDSCTREPIESSADQDWTFRAFTGTTSLIPFFSCTGRSVATLDVQHVDALPASILILLARFGTVHSAKSISDIDSKLVEAGGVEPPSEKARNEKT